MSYDITLCDPVTGNTLYADTPHHMSGGNFALGGTTELCLNVTYNYANWYYKPGVFPIFQDENYSNGRGGIRSIYKMSGAESIPVLKHAIEMLEAMTVDLEDSDRENYKEADANDYWTPTRQNAVKPLYQLLAMAKMRPDGVWEGD